MNIDHNVVITICSTAIIAGVIWRSNSLIMSHFNEKMEIYNKHTNEKIKNEKESAVALAETSYKFLSKTVCDIVDEVEGIQTKLPLLEMSIKQCDDRIAQCQDRCRILRNQHSKEGM